MSEKIKQILEVVQEVRDRYAEAPRTSITRLRTAADNLVADRNNIRRATIWDKYGRQLKPEISGVNDFDRLLQEWLVSGASELARVLRLHCSDSGDLAAIENIFGEADAKAMEAEASDLGKPEGPDRALCTTYRILRDTPLAKKVKAEHNHACQVCGNTLLLNTQPYAEAHHIKPLGSPHDGPDLRENILCVCPNCHVLLDYGAIELVAGYLSTVEGHHIGAEYIEYHNAQIFGRPRRRAELP